MVILLVLLTLILAITADVLVRIILQKIRDARTRKERAVALDIGLRLEFTDDAKSLKRVEVNNPKARILAVDDEPVILDSFRKILVLQGYSVDTVATGKEALGLIQKNNYDFLFTDLKMPEMDGVDVTKAAKHLRPDIDVIMITGYATVESAVETMKYGAMDYVQKPFTEDELVAFVNRSQIRRQARLESQIRPKLHLVTPKAAASPSQHVFNVPAGLFFSPGHAWLSVEPTGAVRIGIDDFARKIIGEVTGVQLPNKSKKIGKGEPLFSIRQGSHIVSFLAPVSGEVTAVNSDLQQNPGLLKTKTYDSGWVCCLEPANLTADLRDLKIGDEAVAWYQKEIDRYMETRKTIETPEAFSQSFLMAKKT